MKFDNFRSPTAPEIKEVDLTEKEIEYISMLRLNVNFNRHRDIFSMSIAEQNKLYRKFGIPEFYKNRDRFLLAFSLINNIVPYETLKNICVKYNLKECEKMLNDIKHAPYFDDEYFKGVNESLISLCKKLNEIYKQ